MKQIGIIKSIVPLTERQYPDQYGQNQIFATLGIVVALGTQMAYIEFVQDTARKAASVFVEGQTIAVLFDMKVREYTDKNGVVRYENRLTGRDYQVFSERAF